MVSLKAHKEHLAQHDPKYYMNCCFCDGTGQHNKRKCTHCAGTGKLVNNLAEWDDVLDRIFTKKSK